MCAVVSVKVVALDGMQVVDTANDFVAVRMLLESGFLHGFVQLDEVESFPGIYALVKF